LIFIRKAIVDEHNNPKMKRVKKVELLSERRKNPQKSWKSVREPSWISTTLQILLP